jgi:hypothetical protein
MDDTASSSPHIQLLSLSQAVEWLRPQSEDQMCKWLGESLEKKPIEVSQPHTQFAIEAFIVDIYRECDPSLKQRLASAFANLLEAFVPNLTPNEAAAEYLSGLLTLASNFRSKRVRERLRRWLYTDMFKDWEQSGANLHGELILATSVYDSDDEWLYHIKHILPSKPFFPRVARHVYRALLDTVGLECIDVLPNVLRALNHNDRDEQFGFGYLLRLTLTKFEQENVLAKVKSVLGAEWRVEMILEDILNFEEFLEPAFSGQRERFEALVADVDERIWKPVTEKWRDLGPEKSNQTFMAIQRVCNPRTVEQFYVSDAIGALDFRGRHYLVVPKTHTHLKSYFAFAAAAANG